MPTSLKQNLVVFMECGGSFFADGTPLPVDHFDGMLGYLSHILMEEDHVDQNTGMHHQDIMALQAAEKSFHDALIGSDEKDGKMREKRKHDHQECDNAEGFGTVYDEALLCSQMNPGFYEETWNSKVSERERWSHRKLGLPKEPKGGRPRADQKRHSLREVVDLNGLLTQCAQAVANYDTRTAHELLNKIRQHSSTSGDATERLAHYMADALEARVSGIGTMIYSASRERKLSASGLLKAYQAHILACPFRKMSNNFANKSIGRLSKDAEAIHIIDFGILYGFQWPCFIQGVSLRPGGPPRLRITGIDLPQQGFRLAERVEETGRRLAYFCKRFNVPFEYHPIAKKKWESITLDDLKIDRSETLVVNCLYRLRNVPDETAEGNTARNDVLNLIKRIKPDVFVHGVLNGTYNVPFFDTRFREALHHFSSLFDMFDKTLPRLDQDRMVFEKEVFGRDSMNVVACEGVERIDRPETYKQWQMRNLKAGFRQESLNQDLVKEVRTKVKLQYHKDFLVDEDSNWILQGWKGRVLYAISCWKPVFDHE